LDWPPIAGDPRFFVRTGPHSLAVVAEAAGGSSESLKHADAARSFVGVAPLQTAEPGQVSFLDNRRYGAALDKTRAGAVILHPEMAARVPAGTIAITTTAPYEGWARVAALFHPLPPAQPGIHSSAVIDPSARIDPSVEIGPFVVIGPRAEIGARCRIGAHAVVGQGVVLGADCRVGALASISHSLIGARVNIYPGARIGQDGFGFAITSRGFLSVPQLGRVIVGDDVEIGANTTVDRGSAQDTMIGAGTRLDNLVQIGHNVRIGRGCVIVAQVGVSGSTIIEDQVMLGGQAGLAGHLHIGRGARVGAQAGVISDVAPGAEVIGSPAQSVRDFFRQVAFLRRLAKRGLAGGKGAGEAGEAGTD